MLLCYFVGDPKASKVFRFRGNLRRALWEREKKNTSSHANGTKLMEDGTPEASKPCRGKLVGNRQAEQTILSKNHPLKEPEQSGEGGGGR